MPLTAGTIDTLAERLDHAARNLRGTRMVSEEHPQMEVADAYAVQDALRRRRLAAGLRQSGFKCGLTSLEKIRQIGLGGPVFGFLTADTALADGAEVSAASMMTPRVEAEIGIVTRVALGGADCGIPEVLAAIDQVVPAIEIIDGRYASFRFDPRDVIADNTSAAGYLLGSERLPLSRDLGNLGVLFYKNGTLIEAASTAAALEHPKHAFAALLAMLRGHGLTELTEGAVILTGGLTAAHAMAPGDHARIILEGLGAVDLHFAP